MKTMKVLLVCAVFLAAALAVNVNFPQGTPGGCPFPIRSPYSGICPVMCGGDDGPGCPEGTLCCGTNCGGSMCVAPVQTRELDHPHPDIMCSTNLK